MLNKVIKIISESNPRIEGSTVLCNHVVDDILLIDSISDLNYIENIITVKPQLGDSIPLEFSLSKLKSLGFFSNKDFFIKEYLYSVLHKEIYFYDSKKYLTDLPFYLSFQTIIHLLQKLKDESKHIYNEEEIINLILFREEKSLFIKLIYSHDDVDTLNDSTINKIDLFIEILSDANFTDKKNIFLNELVEFLNGNEDEVKFSYLINNFDSYFDKSIATYNYYLRNFSYNKLKIELDSKALEFGQKLQTVINDSQTKLIAIPAAFILVLSNLDYDKGDSLKNIISFLGLIIFSILLQLFLNNQKSILKFIDENIVRYKSTFKNQDQNNVEQAFGNVDREKTKQIKRIKVIEILLWLIPILTLCVILFLLTYVYLSILLILSYFVYSFIWINLNANKSLFRRITFVLKI